MSYLAASARNRWGFPPDTEHPSSVTSKSCREMCAYIVVRRAYMCVCVYMYVYVSIYVGVYAGTIHA